MTVFRSLFVPFCFHILFLASSCLVFSSRALIICPIIVLIGFHFYNKRLANTLNVEDEWQPTEPQVAAEMGETGETGEMGETGETGETA